MLSIFFAAALASAPPASPTTSATTTTATTPKTPTAGGPRPDPLAGKSQKDVCNDDALLLLKYSFDDLRNKGFHKNCCTKAALGEDDRCQIDWPSSDVPLCRELDLLRNRLFALYGYVFKEEKFQKAFAAEVWYQPRSDFDGSWMPAVAQKNATRLKAFVKEGNCIPDEAFAAEPAVTAASSGGSALQQVCQLAGVRWSLALQKSSRGQVDGPQQADMAEAITAQCNRGWPLKTAQCFVDGGSARSCALDADFKAAVWKDLVAINPDVKE